jgi:hypothetical protein
MWFEVTSTHGTWPDGTYRGELRNTPFYIAGMSWGCPVEFSPEHVYSVVHDSPDRPPEEREAAP